MEIKIAENIRVLRKRRKLTQEQLADALGVTVGAVSKWESGMTTPELSLIVEMASFFETSVDVLLGYGWQRSSMGQAAERLQELRRERKLKEGFALAEKALGKYPNSFDVVYQSAMLYYVALDKKSCQRAAELFQRAEALLEQNTDEQISVASLENRIADCYLTMGRFGDGVALLKKNNVDGLNNGIIGFMLAANCRRPDEALPYLSEALARYITELGRVCYGYTNYYVQKKDYPNATKILHWLLQVNAGLKLPGKPSFLDKSDALALAICGEIAIWQGDEAAARDYLRQARDMAQRFDALPNYDVGSLKFCQSLSATAYDDIGQTAMAGIDEQFQSEGDVGLLSLWQAVKAETQSTTDG